MAQKKANVNADKTRLLHAFKVYKDANRAVTIAGTDVSIDVKDGALLVSAGGAVVHVLRQANGQRLTSHHSNRAPPRSRRSRLRRSAPTSS
jgi:hypothetical protein